MTIASLIIFALTALLGLTLLYYLIKADNTPKGLAIIHGMLAGLGILFVLIITVLYPEKPLWSLTFFVLAALGGFVMMYRDITGKSLPKWLAMGHGIIAAIGFVLLILFFTANH